MPAQKRPLEEEDPVGPSSEGGPPSLPDEEPTTKEEDGGDADGEGESGSDSDATDNKNEFIYVKLAEIRKDVQCPICLGIIRKTRTVMECLHRFCRECIDKSMRLGNNECPQCRTHCASRRSLRDDPNFDALIIALYRDIDKYEEEECAFHEEEINHNKKIQDYIAITHQRQEEAVRKRRRSAKATARNGRPRGRGRRGVDVEDVNGNDDEEEEDANGNDGRESSSANELSTDSRKRRLSGPNSSLTRTAGNANDDGEGNGDIDVIREYRGTSPLQAGNGEIPTWGKAAVRSQPRHANYNGSYSRHRTVRITKLANYLRKSQEANDKLNVHLTLLPLDKQSIPDIERPYLACKPTLSINHLRQFIASQTSVRADEVEIFLPKTELGSPEAVPSLENLQAVCGQDSIANLLDSFPSSRGNLVLMYCSKVKLVEGIHIC